MNDDAKLIKVGRVGKPGGGHDGNLVYNPEGISPTILSRDYKGPTKIIKETASFIKISDGGGIPIKNATKQGFIMGYDGDGIDLAYPTSKTRRGRVQPQTSQTITTSDNLGVILFED